MFELLLVQDNLTWHVAQLELPSDFFPGNVFLDPSTTVIGFLECMAQACSAI